MLKIPLNTKNAIFSGLFATLAVLTTWLAIFLRSIETLSVPIPVNPYSLLFVIFCLSYLFINGSYTSIKEYKDKLLQNKKFKKWLIISVIILLALFVLRYLLNHFLVTALRGEEMLFLKQIYLTIAISVKYFSFLLISLFGSYVIKDYLYQSQFKLRVTSKSEKTSRFQIIFILFSFIVFISVKLFFLFQYQGMYEDNWLHILAAKDFFKTGNFTVLNEYFGDNGYLRGSYVSLSASFVCNYVSCELIALRFIPSIIGFFSFIALYKILKSLMTKPWIIAAVLLLYSLNPFVIFNHLNLRMYVYYELFVLLGILINLSAIKNVKTHKVRSLLQMLFLLVLGGALYYFSYDRGAVIILFFTAISTLFYGYVFASSLKLNKILAVIKANSRAISITISIVMIVLLAIVVGYFQRYSIADIFEFLPSTNVSSQNGNLLFILFNYFNFLIGGTIVPIIFLDKFSNSLKYVAIVAGSSLLLHSFAPSEYQLMRGFNYVWPVFYITLAVSLSVLYQMLQYTFETIHKGLIRKYPPTFSSKSFVSIIIVAIYSMMILLTLRSSSSYFLSVGPSIHGEVAYYEFEKAFDFVKKIDEDTVIIQSSINFLPNNYFEIEPDYIFQTKHFYESKYLTINKPVLNSYQEVIDVIGEQKACHIIRDSAIGIILDKRTYVHIQKDNQRHYSPQGFEIYCNYDKK